MANEAQAAQSCNTTLSPRYYPLDNFTPEINLQGKVAVITGASRGNGRAAAEALVAQGVEVIGTSRHVATVPHPPTSFSGELPLSIILCKNWMTPPIRR